MGFHLWPVCIYNAFVYIRHCYYLLSTAFMWSYFKVMHSRHCRNNCCNPTDLEVQNLQISNMEILPITPGAGKPFSRNLSACIVWQVNKIPAEKFPWIDAFFHQLYLLFIIWNQFSEETSQTAVLNEKKNGVSLICLLLAVP